MSVLQFPKKDDDASVSHLSGAAKCLACNHTWDAVAAVGVAVLECPSCETHKGVFVAFCRPADGDIWQCNCGSDLFYFTPAGGFCAVCATPQVFP